MGFLQRSLLTAGLLLLTSLIVSNGVQATEQQHCSEEFQEAFEKAMKLKKTCPGVHYKDCCQAAKGTFSDQPVQTGIFNIKYVCEHDSPYLQDISPMQARCNMESRDGGWIVLVRRTPDVPERISFDKPWVDYENGFGNLTGEFWYGLKNMHCLTSSEPMEVEVEVSKADGTTLLFSYGEFRVAGPETSYTLHVSDQKHKGFDYLGYYHNGMKFTTNDRKNDNYGINCAGADKGAWWFNACYNIALTIGHDRNNLFQRSTRVYSRFEYSELRVRAKSCSVTNSDSCGE